VRKRQIRALFGEMVSYVLRETLEFVHPDFLSGDSSRG
jgi:hypothetical protein